LFKTELQDKVQHLIK